MNDRNAASDSKIYMVLNTCACFRGDDREPTRQRSAADTIRTDERRANSEPPGRQQQKQSDEMALGEKGDKRSVGQKTTREEGGCV